MSWFSRLFGGEDSVVRCGWKWATLFRNPKKDPYIEACEWDDAATSEGSTQQKYGIPPERMLQNFKDQLNVLDEVKGRNPDNLLKKFYKSMRARFGGLFLE